MEDTVRALVVVGAAALLLAPLTNAILDDTVPTADRRFLGDLEYDGEPPPFTGDPPEDFEPPPGDGDLDGEFEGEFDGPIPTCPNPTGREEAAWRHLDPQTSLTGRTVSEQPFTVGERDLAVRATFRIDALYGDIAWSLTNPNGDEIPVGSKDGGRGDNVPPVPFDVRADEEGFEPGEWSASIDFSGTITYQRLEYVIVVLYCPEGA